MQIHPKTKEAYDLFHEGVLAFCRAEQVGMHVDLDYCARQIDILDNRIQKLEGDIRSSQFGRHWGHSVKGAVNLNSNQQLSHFLYTIQKRTPAGYTDAGNPATDEQALSALDVPELDMLIEMRKLAKVRDTYLGAFVREQVRGVIHPFFNLHLVRTFRSSSDHPNFQNIPKRDEEATKICRSALFPRLGNQFLSMDYGGIEVRQACIYTEDQKLIYDVLHGDMHRDMAIELYMLDDLDKHHKGESKLRQGGKNGFVFPQFYGDYWGGCAPNLIRWAKLAHLRDDTPAIVHLQDKGLIKLDKSGNVVNISAFEAHVKKVEESFWNERYKTYSQWKDKAWKDYQKRGYLDMLSGFRCSGVMSKKDVTNYPFQGTAFHCLLWSFIEIDRRIREQEMDARLVSQIHDEITADVPPKELARMMEMVVQVSTQDIRTHWKWITIPLEVEAELAKVDESWGARKFFPLAA